MFTLTIGPIQRKETTAMGSTFESLLGGREVREAKARARRETPSYKARKLAEQVMEDLKQLENLDSWQAESPLTRLTARALVANVYATLAVESAIKNQTQRICADLERPDLH
jgi:hypothetical protein